MTRDEEIRQASIAYTQVNNPVCIGGDNFKEMIDALNVNPAFIAGAEWADQHQPSPWISVEESLPWGYLACEWVAVRRKEYNNWYKAYYDGDDWRCIDEDGDEMTVFDVTHWMPIPGITNN